jgi:hypothetical protein
MTVFGHAVLFDPTREKRDCFSENSDAVAQIPIEKETS